jgi:mannose-6-phosphate isomerase-like protein (cupin superfamily)
VDFLGNQIEYLYIDADSPLSLLKWLMPSGTPSPPVHVHHRTDEGFYVLRGEIAVFIDGKQSTYAADAYVHVKRGQHHTFWNPGPNVAEYLVLISPAGFEAYFRELAARLDKAASEEAAMAVRKEMSAKYDIEVVGPPIQP